VKISELIWELELVLKTDGDLPVKVDHGHQLNDIEEAGVDADGIEFIIWPASPEIKGGDKWRSSVQEYNQQGRLWV